MAAKPKMQCITEPGEQEVHYVADPLSGNVTLCGLTDFIGVEPGQYTGMRVTCKVCVSIFKWCNTHRA